MSEVQRSAGAITVRQLARDTSAVIDRVRETKAPMLITRYGMPVATIQPLDIDLWEAPRGRTKIPELEESPIDWERLKLDDTLKRVMAAVEDPFTMEDVIDACGVDGGKAALTCAYLEIKHLAIKTMMGYRLTKRGRRVSEELSGKKSSAQKRT